MRKVDAVRHLVLLLFAFVISVLACGFSANANELSDTDTLNESYQKIYDECLNGSFDTICDDYSAYAFLLSNISDVKVGSSIALKSVPSNLSESERRALEDFMERLNYLISVDAITVNERLQIRIAEAPAPSIRIRLDAQIMDLMPEARNHATELRNVYDSAPFNTGAAVAGVYFADRVRYGGIWDYKVFLGQNTRYFVPIINAMMTGETIGNFHYGYVGSSCFPPELLKASAGFVQIVHGTSDLSYWNSYFDDPRDQEDIQWGINRYNAEH